MLGLIALGIIAATGFVWFQLIENVSVPRNRVGYLSLFLLGGLVGIFAISQGGFFSTAFAIPAVLVGFVFPALRMQSGQKPNTPAIEVGGDMLNFVAPDANGVDFDLSSLHGKPYLLKFFRGHW